MSETFWRLGFHVFADLASASQVAMLARGMDVAETQGRLADQTYSSASDAVGAYSPVPGEMMLRHCRSRLEAAIGRELIENYAYWRRYNRGSVLRRHKDRTGCEITVTLTIDTPPGTEAWPIMLTDFEDADGHTTTGRGADVSRQSGRTLARPAGSGLAKAVVPPLRREGWRIQRLRLRPARRRPVDHEGGMMAAISPLRHMTSA